MRHPTDAGRCRQPYRQAMATISVQVLAGTASTVIFTSSVLPMLVKAWRSKDLRSYSLSNLVLSNIGNAVHTVYVLHLPAGPIWVLHGFYVVTSALMLIWYLAGLVPAGTGEHVVPQLTIPVAERLPLVGVTTTYSKGNAHGS
jgi:uncharacterized protein with PQ loop repeat